MKKILFSLILISLTLVSAVGATRAYFTDQEVLGENSFTTGTLILDVTDDEGSKFTWSASGIKPGWNETKTIKIINYGSLPFIARAKFEMTINNIDDELLPQAMHFYINGTDMGNVYALIGSGRTVSLGTIPSDSNQTYTLKLDLPATVGNEVQYRNFFTNIKIEATQIDNTDFIGF